MKNIQKSATPLAAAAVATFGLRGVYPLRGSSLEQGESLWKNVEIVPMPTWAGGLPPSRQQQPISFIVNKFPHGRIKGGLTPCGSSKIFAKPEGG